MSPFDLHEIIAPSATVAEIVLRGTVLYWFLFLMLRFVLHRDTGSAGVSDILFVVLLGDAAQNGMIGQHDGVADSLLLIATLVAWNYLLDYLAYHFTFFRWLTEPPAVRLVRNGRLVREALRREHLTEEMIAAKARDAGVERLRDVKAIYLESDGTFSVLKRRR
jgi:uncharacterized membrane protein YcaP (DUF421 family)